MGLIHDPSGDKMDPLNCKHLTKSKDEDGKELEKKKEEHD